MLLMGRIRKGRCMPTPLAPLFESALQRPRYVVVCGRCERGCDAVDQNQSHTKVDTPCKTLGGGKTAREYEI